MLPGLGFPVLSVFSDPSFEVLMASTPEQRLRWRQQKRAQMEERQARLKEVEEREKRIAEEEKVAGVPKLLSDMRWAYRNLGLPVKGDESQQLCRNWLKRNEKDFTDSWMKREAEFKKEQADAKSNDDPGGCGRSIEYALNWLREYQEEHPNADRPS
jgi:hypothetical protein